MNLNKHKIDRAYVSEHDIFLHKFDKEHPAKSISQQNEIAQHQKITSLRDEQIAKPKSSLIKKLFRVFFG